jgi:hypothetical protein
MKATMEWSWDIENVDEKHSYMAAMQGEQMATVLTEFFQILRKDWKYSEDEKRGEMAEEYRDKLSELLEEYGVTLES